ncbi:hypothetical protein SRHO_G00326600 [Serrasalmus rhombeus]
MLMYIYAVTGIPLFKEQTQYDAENLTYGKSFDGISNSFSTIFTFSPSITEQTQYDAENLTYGKSFDGISNSFSTIFTFSPSITGTPCWRKDGRSQG